jgi:hypothetical protein
MNINIKNFFQAIAPLAKSKIELGDFLIISFLENAWKVQDTVQVNDLIHGITNLSPSTIHRRLRKMNLNQTLQYRINEENQRVRFIEKGNEYKQTTKNLHQ